VKLLRHQSEIIASQKKDNKHKPAITSQHIPCNELSQKTKDEEK